ncbi:hypothetical protein Tco_0704451 [Tanacetum coccineum]|uniref:Retrovirus-related Pol polyprotein from transposon TNT 1-94-like beta-barrel domain-containing protein n=1 Tax=Tanacetum coccineum TaxID=301880 RepID=A0ABQ4Y1M9_9ASTR
MFYLKKAQRIKPTLYDGSVISSQHAVIHVIDDEKTLILEEVCRSKMLAKQNDPISKEKKINTTPINYVELNRLSEDFGKHFIPQQELSAEQAFCLQTSHPNTNQSDISPVKIEAPRELPKSMENTNLKGQIQEKVFVITSLKNDLRKLKGKEVVENAAQLPNTTTITPGMFKLDLDPLAPSSEPNHSWGSSATDVPSSYLINDRLSRLFSGTVRFGNDQIAKIMGYGDYQLGNVTISRVYYVEGLKHNLFSIG